MVKKVKDKKKARVSSKSAQEPHSDEDSKSQEPIVTDPAEIRKIAMGDDAKKPKEEEPKPAEE